MPRAHRPRWQAPRVGAMLICMAPLGLWASAVPAQVASTHASFFDDMRQLRTIDELAISPDGRWAAYVTSDRFDPDTAGPTSITILDLVGRGARAVRVRGHPRGLQWTGGSRSALTFLATADGRNHILRYSPSDSGSVPRRVAISDSLGGEILAFAWSPDGASIAYLAAEDDAAGRTSESSPPAPRLVLFNDSPDVYTGPTSPLYSRDSTGAYVAIEQVGQASARVLARHVVSAKNRPSIAWSHSGMLLVNGVATRVSWLVEITSGLVYAIDPSSGAVRQVEPGSRNRKRATWSPSGRRIASLRVDVLPEGKLPLARYTLQVETPVELRASVSFDAETDGLVQILPPMWGGDDRTLYVARYRRATARLFAVDPTRGKWRPVTPDTLSISRYAVSQDGKVLLGVLENANQPQEIFRIDPVSGALTRLTHNAERVPAMRLGHVDQVAWHSRDGRFTVHGFLVEPPGYDSTRCYPLIVLVHGGPGGLFTNSFVGINFAPPSHLPPQLLASAGYMVLLPNPRGDASYGEEFEVALHADWASGPFSDVDAGVDALIARGLVDSSRVGIAGASYGGYLAAYAITQTHRFAAASIDDAPTDLTSEYGQNYATRSTWAKVAFDGTPWTNPALYASQSPITYVSRVRTPVIMRYGGRSSTHDHVRQSYMLAQGFELYAGLRDTGVPVQFVLHPEEGHGIGDWELYRDWMTRNLRWFNYWLRHEGTNPVASTCEAARDGACTRAPAPP